MTKLMKIMTIISVLSSLSGPLLDEIMQLIRKDKKVPQRATPLVEIPRELTIRGTFENGVITKRKRSTALQQ